ncbi:MAG: hypothetical protein IJU50_02650 [Lachnospiraceae bacterium]|nr:hypothetical protein [Lachnospiraceae bacterium]
MTKRSLMKRGLSIIAALALTASLALPGAFLPAPLAVRAAEENEPFYGWTLITKDIADDRIWPAQSLKKDEWYRLMIVWDSTYCMDRYRQGANSEYEGRQTDDETYLYGGSLSYAAGNDVWNFDEDMWRGISVLGDGIYKGIREKLESIGTSRTNWLSKSEYYKQLIGYERATLEAMNGGWWMKESDISACHREINNNNSYFVTEGALGTPFIKYAGKQSSYHFRTSGGKTTRPNCYYIALSDWNGNYAGSFLETGKYGLKATSVGQAGKNPPSSGISDAIGTWCIAGPLNAALDAGADLGFGGLIDHYLGGVDSSFPAGFFYQNSLNYVSLCWEKSTGGSAEQQNESSKWHGYPLNFTSNILCMGGGTQYQTNALVSVYIGAPVTDMETRGTDLRIPSGQIYHIDTPLLVRKNASVIVEEDAILVVDSTFLLSGSLLNKGLVIVEGGGGYMGPGIGRAGPSDITCLGGDILVRKGGYFYAAPRAHPPLRLQKGASLVNAGGNCLIGCLVEEDGCLIHNRKGSYFYGRYDYLVGYELNLPLYSSRWDSFNLSDLATIPETTKWEDAPDDKLYSLNLFEISTDGLLNEGFYKSNVTN